MRGFVSAYDCNTGELVWRFYTVPGNPDDGFEDATQAMAAETWTGTWWQYGGGDNLFLSSIVARNRNTAGSGRVPDLTIMPGVYYDNFNQIVLDGALATMGMVGFRDVMDEADADDVKAFLLHRANDAWELHTQPDWWVAIKRWFYGVVATIVAWLAQ